MITYPETISLLDCLAGRTRAAPSGRQVTHVRPWRGARPSYNSTLPHSHSPPNFIALIECEQCCRRGTVPVLSSVTGGPSGGGTAGQTWPPKTHNKSHCPAKHWGTRIASLSPQLKTAVRRAGANDAQLMTVVTAARALMLLHSWLLPATVVL